MEMKNICYSIKPIFCKRLEKFDTGEKVRIVGLREINYRNKARFILSIENYKNEYFLSNYWLEKVIKDSNIDINFPFNIQFGFLKTTPSKHMEKSVFIINQGKFLENKNDCKVCKNERIKYGFGKRAEEYIITCKECNDKIKVVCEKINKSK